MHSPIIFLDFDGVIRVPLPGESLSPDPADFCQARMKQLADVCQATGARLVISSDWRHLENLPEIRALLSPYLTRYLHQDWNTPICGHRWNEVGRWLRDHDEVTRYAILEDFAPHFEGCPPEMAARIILCTNRHGLVPELIPRLIATLTS